MVSGIDGAYETKHVGYHWHTCLRNYISPGTNQKSSENLQTAPFLRPRRVPKNLHLGAFLGLRISCDGDDLLSSSNDSSEESGVQILVHG